ncbi:MAG: GAF domain-containing protein [Candidatus Hydrogenedentota bacterium]|nr:MAG: GAF domain-containing protein [Candidatus Hydrogenedentota bacterium]
MERSSFSRWRSVSEFAPAKRDTMPSADRSPFSPFHAPNLEKVPPPPKRLGDSPMPRPPKAGEAYSPSLPPLANSPPHDYPELMKTEIPGTILGLVRSLSGAAPPKKLLHKILNAAVRITRADTGSIILIDRRTSSLSIEAARGFADRVVKATRLGIGEGITGWVAKHGRSLRVDDVRTDRRYVPLKKNIRSEMAAPLIIEKTVIGVINVDSTRKKAFTKEQQEALETLAAMSSRVIADALIHDRLRKRSEQLETLVRIAGKISSIVNLDRLLEEVTSAATSLLGARMAVVRLLNPARDSLVIAAVHGASKKYAKDPPTPVKNSVLGKVLFSGKPLLVPDIAHERRFRFKEMAVREGVRSMIAVPLHVGTEPLGTLAIYHPVIDGFPEDSLTIATGLAGLAAAAIQNARLFSNVVESDERFRLAQLRNTANAMTAELAHEIRNPITVARLLVMGKPSDPPEFLGNDDRNVIIRELDRVDGLISRMLQRAGETAAPFTTVDLNLVLSQVLVPARAKAATRNLLISFSNSANLPPVRARMDDLWQAFSNLLDNALDAARSSIHVSLRPVSRKKAVQGIEVVFEDDGPGLPEDFPIFEPMATTKKHGVGVGLFSVRRLILEHGGTIQAGNSPRLGGARFRIRLPAAVASS